MIAIREFMTSDIKSVDAEDSIFEAAQIMKENDIGFLPVIEEGKLVGVVTDRDLAIKGIAKKLSIKAPIKEVMTAKCISVDSQTPIQDALKIMSDHKIRRLCIVENGQLAGICAIGDIAITRHFERDAAEALSEISSPIRRQMVEN
ncbi:MAG: CBS domain-containing protein [Bacillota bacterium]|jgi:CBS domain-containing protein|nr:CBS domain-containing protein [Bacillota bacterium]HHU43744.1 CBS domain-containing protein [Clostridiales bacterium]